MKSLWLFLALAVSARASLVEIIAARDATLYDDPTASPLANGAGQHFFAGVNGENNDFAIRRALLYFDLVDLPSDALITSAAIRLYVNRAPVTSHPTDVFSLYRVTENWTTGDSDPSGPEGSGTGAQPGDATWYHASFSNVLWTSAGGAFAASASASSGIGGIGFHEMSSDQMALDVQNWVNGSANNHGWILRGDESLSQSVRRFYSTESGEDTAPTLIVGYEIVPEPRALFAAGLAAIALGRLRKPRRGAARTQP